MEAGGSRIWIGYGASSARLAARHLGSSINHPLSQSPRQVLLLRCCPASPFTLLNYALGSTSLPFLHYFWPSVVGIAPGIAVFVYGGALITDLSDVTHSDGLANATTPQGEGGGALLCRGPTLAVTFSSPPPSPNHPTPAPQPALHSPLSPESPPSGCWWGRRFTPSAPWPGGWPGLTATGTARPRRWVGNDCRAID